MWFKYHNVKDVQVFSRAIDKCFTREEEAIDNCPTEKEVFHQEIPDFVLFSK